MWKKIKTFLRNPVWVGIGVIATGFGIFRKDIFNGLPYVVIFVGNGIQTPLGIFSAVLFFLSLLGFFFFWRGAWKVKVGVCVLLVLSLAGFTFAGLSGNSSEQLEDAQRAAAELGKRLATYREIIQHKDNEFALINREKKKLTEELENRKKQLETYRGRIKQKDNDISSMKKHTSKLEVQLADLISKVKDLQNKVVLLEGEKEKLQVEISRMKESTAIPPVNFVYTGKKLFLRDGDKENELFDDYEICCFSQSKSKKKIALIGSKGPKQRYMYQGYTYRIIVFNADRGLSNLSIWTIRQHSHQLPRNLKWVSDTVLRVNLFEQQLVSLMLDHIKLKGTGTYEITIDEINSLVNVKKSTGLSLGGS